LIRRENIFEAHRSHFYQFLANERKVPHLLVASLYALIQLVINTVFITTSSKSEFSLVLSVVIFTIIFIAVRLFLEGRDRLLKPL